ncbi:MAG: hypothetical protein CM15mP83_6040 [Flavobacteriaceae bacterium]|nr:MAG: hypothetical protein CM15mP83_6040 [Flavobacteriaceae bacterium]
MFIRLQKQSNHETFDKAACKFGYRDSIFKNELKNKVVITDVSLRLKRELNLNTPTALLNKSFCPTISCASPKDVSDAVINIRSNKLPDPKQLGNAGSF